MRNRGSTFILIALLFTTQVSWAVFTSPAPEAQNQPVAQASFWTEVKTKVQKAWSSFWNSDRQNETGQVVAQQSTVPGSSGNRGPASVPEAAITKTAPAAPVAQVTQTSAVISFKEQSTKIKDLEVSRPKQAARPYSKQKFFALGKERVPVFEFKKFKALPPKVQRIPVLDVGMEVELDPQPFGIVNVEPFPLVKEEKIQILSTPAVLTEGQFHEALGPAVVQASPAEKIEVPRLEPEKKVTQERVAKLVYTVVQDSPVTPLEVQHFDEEDLKYLRGLILVQNKDNCHLGAGLFADLVSSKKSEISTGSHHHLGVCLTEMKLPTEAIHHLSAVIKGHDPLYAPKALKATLESELPRHLENEVAAMFLDAAHETQLSKEQAWAADFLKVKYFLRKGEPAKALNYVSRIPAEAPQHARAEFLAAVAEYEVNKIDEAIARLKVLVTELEKKGGDKNLQAMAYVNMGRMAFQKGKNKESLEAFQKIQKEHPMWISALQEQAWVQLQSKDAAGAIGNMHSIQSPYFDGVFKPDSYVVRSIGYLNICQYGDAAKTLAYLEYRYGPWLAKIDQFNKTHSAVQSYETVIKHLESKTKSKADVDGLPYQAIREVAHHKDYINIQENMNSLIDEKNGYPFIKGLIDKDIRSLSARKTNAIMKAMQLKAKIKLAPVTPGAMKNINAWKQELAAYEDLADTTDFKIATVKESLKGFDSFVPVASSRLATVRTDLKSKAGKVIKDHFVAIAKSLKHSLENNELLNYEIYAGSGENLRSQVAGAKTAPTKKLERRPANMDWDFDGEIWEDEIGHYRSSLKNNCRVQEGGVANRQ